MSGTFHSHSGLRRITRRTPPVNLRIASFAVAVLLGAILFTWLESTRWRQIRNLERDFAAVRAERYYLGIKLRLDAQRLHNTLTRFYRFWETADLDRFRQKAQELTRWVQSQKALLATPREQEQFSQAEGALATYLESVSPLLKETSEPHTYEIFNRQPDEVQQLSQPLFESSDQFEQSQRDAFGEFLGESQRTLTAHRRLLKLSFALLVALAGVLVVLVYRGMIAPLRIQLIESHDLLERQEKLASLGVLAAGVAHEIRNPLTAIKFRLFSLRKSVAAVHDNEDAEVIGSEINRLERIVKDFLQFARPSEPELVETTAQRILLDVHDLLESQLEKVSIRLNVEPSEAAWVRADVHQIKQVLINLIQNSADSIGRNGAITLRVSSETARLDGNVVPVVLLEVNDTGKGIPTDVEKRLFDPFFTTKEGGTGLGLPIAARIIEKHGGELRYESELDHGATFRIVLPRIPSHETETSADRR